MNRVQSTYTNTSFVRKVDDFIVGCNISKSSFSSVYIGFHKPTNQKVAVKMISKRKMKKVENCDKIIFAETKISPFLFHPHISRVLKCFETTTSYFQVNEFYKCDLLSYLIENNPNYEEKTEIIDQVLSAIEYLHKHNICHRDIKLDNILMNDDGEAFLSDFGFSAFATSRVSGYLGSDGYTAPEIISGKNQAYDGIAADLWSTGVLIYAIFANTLPFEKTRDPTKLDPSKIDYSLLTPEIEEVVRHLIVTEPQGRMQISDIRYLKAFENISDRKADISPIPEYNDNVVKEIVKNIFDNEDIEEKFEEVGMNPEKSMYQIISENISKETSKPFAIPLSLPEFDIEDIKEMYERSILFCGSSLDAIKKVREFFMRRNFCVSVANSNSISVIRNHIEKDISIIINVSPKDKQSSSISLTGNDIKEVEGIANELSSSLDA